MQNRGVPTAAVTPLTAMVVSPVGTAPAAVTEGACVGIAVAAGMAVAAGSGADVGAATDAEPAVAALSSGLAVFFSRSSCR